MACGSGPSKNSRRDERRKFTGTVVVSRREDHVSTHTEKLLIECTVRSLSLETSTRAEAGSWYAALSSAWVQARVSR